MGLWCYLKDLLRKPKERETGDLLNPEGICKRFKELNPGFKIVPWHIRNSVRVQATVKAWKKKKAQIVRNRRARERWRKSEFGKLSLRISRHRRRKNGKGGKFSFNEWQKILIAYQFSCAYCGERPEKLTIDHIIPLSKGGLNTKENIAPSCSICNSKKGTKFWLPKYQIRL